MIDPTLLTGNIGPNTAHRVFKKRLVNSRVFFFSFNGNRGHIRDWFRSHIGDAHEKSGSHGFSIGVYTDVHRVLVDYGGEEECLIRRATHCSRRTWAAVDGSSAQILRGERLGEEGE